MYIHAIYITNNFTILGKSDKEDGKLFTQWEMLAKGFILHKLKFVPLKGYELVDNFSLIFLTDTLNSAIFNGFL